MYGEYCTVDIVMICIFRMCALTQHISTINPKPYTLNPQADQLCCACFANQTNRVEPRTRLLTVLIITSVTLTNAACMWHPKLIDVVSYARHTFQCLQSWGGSLVTLMQAYSHIIPYHAYAQRSTHAWCVLASRQGASQALPLSTGFPYKVLPLSTKPEVLSL
jgi:hypothetical protein